MRPGSSLVVVSRVSAAAAVEGVSSWVVGFSGCWTDGESRGWVDVVPDWSWADGRAAPGVALLRTSEDCGWGSVSAVL